MARWEVVTLSAMRWFNKVLSTLTSVLVSPAISTSLVNIQSNTDLVLCTIMHDRMAWLAI